MGCKNGTCGCKKNHRRHSSNHNYLNLTGTFHNTAFPLESNFSSPAVLKVESQVVQLRFKNNRKAFFQNPGIVLEEENARVVVDVNNGTDIGTVIMTGSGALKLFKKRYPDSDVQNLNRILRIANDSDISQWLEARKNDKKVLKELRDFTFQNKLLFDISDVETRADGKSALVFLSGFKDNSPDAYKKIFEEVSGMQISEIV